MAATINGIHIVTVEELEDMLQAHRDNSKRVIVNIDGCNHPIIDVSYDGIQGYMLINVHGDEKTKERLKELDEENTELNREIEWLKEANKKLTEEAGKFAAEMETAVQNIRETFHKSAKATNES